MWTFKYRIRPTNDQVKKLWEHSRKLNWVHNQLIDAEHKSYESNNKYLNAYALNKILVELKQQDPTLYEIHSQVLQQISFRIHHGYTAFFKGVIQHPPDFRSCANFYTITYPQSGYSIRGRILTTTAYGNIPIVLHRPIQGNIKQVSIGYDDHWYLCVVTDYKPVFIRPAVDLGIDLGTSNLVVTSDNQVIRGPNHMKYYDSQIAKLQLKMDARYPLTKGEDNKNHISRNRRHLNDVIRKLCRVKRTKTNDILHKISTDLSRRYDTVYMEDLKLKKMSETKATGRNREIRNKCIGRFCDMLKYKVNHLQVVNPMYTSQTCAYCGHKHEKKLPLYRRTFICDECGLVIDRDYNAALNILHLGRASRSGLYKDNVSIVDIHPYMWWDNDTRKCLEQAIDENRYSGLHREAPSFRGE